MRACAGRVDDAKGLADSMVIRGTVYRGPTFIPARNATSVQESSNQQGYSLIPQ